MVIKSVNVKNVRHRFVLSPDLSSVKFQVEHLAQQWFRFKVSKEHTNLRTFELSFRNNPEKENHDVSICLNGMGVSASVAFFALCCFWLNH